MLQENIKIARKARGLSQQQLADRLHVVRQTVSKWEQGLSVPDADLLLGISQVLETPVSALLEQTAEDAPAPKTEQTPAAIPVPKAVWRRKPVPHLKRFLPPKPTRRQKHPRHQTSTGRQGRTCSRSAKSWRRSICSWPKERSAGEGYCTWPLSSCLWGWRWLLSLLANGAAHTLAGIKASRSCLSAGCSRMWGSGCLSGPHRSCCRLHCWERF